MSRKIFIDGGGNNGSSVRYFKQKKDLKNEYEIYSFEPNKKFISVFEELQGQYPQLYFFPYALSDKNGETTFYHHLDNSSASTTSDIKGNQKNCGSNIPGTVVKEIVKCIDLSQWIMQNFDSTDYIHLKLDVECAEYEILEKMINDDSISYLNFLSIEWHSHRCHKTATQNERLEAIMKEKGIEIDNTWNTMGY